MTTQRAWVLLAAVLTVGAAASPVSASVPALGSVGGSIDGPFCSFAEPRLRHVADADAATASRRGLQPAVPHRRSLAFVAKDARTGELAFVEPALAKPLAEKVFDSVSIVGGVFVMGMSMLLP